jgi:hypothetical protein
MWTTTRTLREGWRGLALAFEWWWMLLSIPRSSDYLCEYVDFWEELGSGWMSEYIWPYDDWFNPSPSPERKLRLGRR